MDYYLRQADCRVTAIPTSSLFGGEAAICRIVGDAHQVLKDYHDPVPDDLEPRLEYQIDHPPPTIADRLAWPLDLVEDSRGKVVGYLQRFFGPPYVTLAEALDNVHPPAWVTAAELRRIAYEISFLIAELHAAGYLFPDIHPGQFLCAAGKPTVVIDLAACHFDAGGELFTCRRARDEYQPPELLAATDRDVAIDQRDAHGDDWSLAVVLFQIAMGCLPFQGVYAGKGNVPTLVERIVQGHFPFDKNCQQFRPPPAVPRYRDVHPELRDLFHACFVDGHASQNRSLRPNAARWADTLHFCPELRAAAVVPPPSAAAALPSAAAGIAAPASGPLFTGWLWPLATAACLGAVVSAAAFQIGDWAESSNPHLGVPHPEETSPSTFDLRPRRATTSAETILDRFRHPTHSTPGR